MNRLRNNLVANFGGQIWTMAMGVAFIPVYIHVLGIEAYGLIGFFLSLQAFFLILDMGLSATLNRELARYTHSGASAREKRDLVRTLECLYWPVGIVIALAVIAGSERIATGLLNPVSLSSARTAHAIALMGLAAALQWPCGLYAGGLRGLERQVALNALNAVFATLRGAGSALVIAFVSPTIEAFLWWQVLVASLHTLTSAFLLWRLLPTDAHRPTFRAERLRQLRGFALGMAGTVALSFFLMQSDRVVLAKLLPLNEFGYYVVAATVASALTGIVQPFFAALFPRFTGLVTAGKHDLLVKLYHQSNQILAVFVMAVAAMMVLFAGDLLLLWTNDAVLAAKAGPVLSLLVIGTALNGLMYLPFALQLANGWTRLSMLQNLVAVVVFVPLVWLLSQRFGGRGAATAWIALNVGYLCISVPLMHRVLMKGEMRAWYLQDMLPPAIAAILTALLMRLLVPQVPSGLSGAVALIATGLPVLAVAGLVSPAVREVISQHWTGLTRRSPQ
ncbi:oligosaccharide flippase family protein [Arenimonas oryziterrae]|uniref:Polysaccharide biosynthesis protein C-terminal domain-containing protein n=1 Tax=Arenimonas oryziterrae DSM 21050 = YC6267 TaxID=1121015 RepID=A0A091AWT8_9GAMM|nr:oligosaccharide flippase family protein [Arenimonas oryziterrae]KFN43129.1 hypothetical protein N789_11240 [Arenimonas oryziterrae DSM 21050 = YC6267]